LLTKLKREDTDSPVSGRDCLNDRFKRSQNFSGERSLRKYDLMNHDVTNTSSSAGHEAVA